MKATLPVMGFQWGTGENSDVLGTFVCQIAEVAFAVDPECDREKREGYMKQEPDPNVPGVMMARVFLPDCIEIEYGGIGPDGVPVDVKYIRDVN